MDDHFLDHKLNERRGQDAFRQLRLPDGKTDFCSNDYLGIVTNGLLEAGKKSPETGPGHPAGEAAAVSPVLAHGSAGSRLLAGNYPLIEETEKALAGFHQAEAGLLFNSGYDANLGVLSCIPRRGDTIVYDSLSHASIRDGIRLSFAQSFSFAHNDCTDLERRLQAASGGGARLAGSNLFVVTESVFSMDGDLAPLETILSLCRRYDAYLILDEAHATGVIGGAGEGLAQAGGLHRECFARIHTFGKAVGCHGAIVLGSTRLRQFLVNFCRPLIYTTALPPASVRAIADAYRLFPVMKEERTRLGQLIDRWQQTSIGYERLNSHTPIQVVIVPGNAAVRGLAARLQEAGLDIRPILYPTVPKGSERLRIVIHSFNTVDEIDRLTGLLQP